jgi:SAM-dependent methyltransferase
VELVIGLLAGVLLLFAGIVFYGAPYVPTLQPQIVAAFELLELRPGQTVLELGSGDGKVLLAAAAAGYSAVGVELNPLLVLVSRWRTRRFRRQVRVVWGNFWKLSWPESDGVYVFLLDRYMTRLDQRMQHYKKPLVSVAFRVPGREPSAQKNGVFRYEY